MDIAYDSGEKLFPEITPDLMMRLKAVFNQFLFSIERCLDVPDIDKRVDYAEGSTPGGNLPDLLAAHFRMLFRFSRIINTDFEYEYVMQFSPTARNVLFTENAGPGFPEKKKRSRLHIKNRQSDRYM